MSHGIRTTNTPFIRARPTPRVEYGSLRVGSCLPGSHFPIPQKRRGVVNLQQRPRTPGIAPREVLSSSLSRGPKSFREVRCVHHPKTRPHQTQSPGAQSHPQPTPKPSQPKPTPNQPLSQPKTHRTPALRTPHPPQTNP